MNISPRSTSRWSKRLVAGTIALALIALAYLAAAPAQTVGPPSSQKRLPPFLDTFRADSEPPIVSKTISFASATGTVKGYVARPGTKEALPAVLLIHDETGLTPWMELSARELASIGFVVLAVDLEKRLPVSGKAAGPLAALADEATLTDLSAAVRWLRRRPDVLPDRIGVVGWAWGGEQALALAAATPLQGCAVCYAPLTDAPALIAGLRGTPVLAIVAGRDPKLDAFRKAVALCGCPCRVREFAGLSPGFMRPRQGKLAAHAETEEAWVAIYNFLGKYVEDAPEHVAGTAAPAKLEAVATVADVMRAVNNPETGVRGLLIRALEKEPGSPKEWQSVRAGAALIAEAGGLLQERLPSKGSHDHWLGQARVYTGAARRLVAAADKHDFAEARRGLAELGASCAACHKQHR
jgi:carboxymethylenebutenolidase